MLGQWTVYGQGWRHSRVSALLKAPIYQNTRVFLVGGLILHITRDPCFLRIRTHRRPSYPVSVLAVVSCFELLIFVVI